MLTIDIEAENLIFAEIIFALDKFQSDSPIEWWKFFFNELRKTTRRLQCSEKTFFLAKKIFEVDGTPSRYQTCFKNGYYCGDTDGVYISTTSLINAKRLIVKIVPTKSFHHGGFL